MRYAIYNNIKTNAKNVMSGSLGYDIWHKRYRVIAYVGKYRQYWKYLNKTIQLPQGYEEESDWHIAWKEAILDQHCEVVCGTNNEHRADIMTKTFIIEIQKSPIDGRDVIERNKFYKDLSGQRLVWVVNIESAWKKKRLHTILDNQNNDNRFIIQWKYAWKWVLEMVRTNDTYIFLDFKPDGENLIFIWMHKGILYGKWTNKIEFFNQYLLAVSKPEYKLNPDIFLKLFHNL